MYIHSAISCFKTGVYLLLVATPAMSYVFNFYAGVPPPEGTNTAPPPSRPRAIRARSEELSPRRHHRHRRHNRHRSRSRHNPQRGGTTSCCSTTTESSVTIGCSTCSSTRGLACGPGCFAFSRLSAYFCTASAASSKNTTSRRTSSASKVRTCGAVTAQIKPGL